MARRTCYGCRKRPAKVLPAERDGLEYVNATSEVIFCSFRCAANWALLWVVDLDEPRWCDKHGAWANASTDDKCCDG